MELRGRANFECELDHTMRWSQHGTYTVLRPKLLIEFVTHLVHAVIAQICAAIRVIRVLWLIRVVAAAIHVFNLGLVVTDITLAFPAAPLICLIVSLPLFILCGFHSTIEV